MQTGQTIAAIATPQGSGGVGVIRISGPDAKKVLKSLWKSRGTSVDNFVTNRLYYGKVVLSSTGENLDSGLAVWMKAPHSYTGEDVVEIQVHSSPLLLEKILEFCLAGGARLAEPGEFTKRAYLNGKLDLAQAEGVADLIAASSEAGLKEAKRHFSGQFSSKINEFQTELIRLRAFVEASIDFPEEDIELIQKEGIHSRLIPIQVAIEELLETYAEGHLYREGVKTVLVGRPNVGKSSLMNALLGVERSIVHTQAGTTRDIIEEACQLEGFVFHLFDTAGLRKAESEVEAMGVSLSERHLKEADLILWLVDASGPLRGEDIDFLSTLDLSKTFICANKIDLGRAWNPEALLLEKEEKKLVYLSALKGEGLDRLKQNMVGWVKQLRPKESGGIKVTKMRHKEALEESLRHLKNGSDILNCRSAAVELLAHHLTKAHQALGKITGANVTEDLLDSIFREFCIGK